MTTSLTIAELLAREDVVFMGSDWKKDETAKDGPLPGFRYVGEKPCVNCNDVFFWGCADGEDITEETLPAFNQAVDDCRGDVALAAWLYCARIRKERPQGAAYTFIPKDLWPLFHACGPERKTDCGNPYKPGQYKIKDEEAKPKLFNDIKLWLWSFLCKHKFI